MQDQSEEKDQPVQNGREEREDQEADLKQQDLSYNPTSAAEHSCPHSEDKNTQEEEQKSGEVEEEQQVRTQSLQIYDQQELDGQEEFSGESDDEPLNLHIEVDHPSDEEDSACQGSTEQNTIAQPPSPRTVLALQRQSFIDEKLKKCDHILKILNQSQDSVVKTSRYFIKLANQDEAFVSLLTAKVRECLATALNCKKLRFVYLMNDLIQKSKLDEIKQLDVGKWEEGKGFWRELAAVTEQVMPEVLKGFNPDERKIKLDVVRVLLVWEIKGYYSEDFIQKVLTMGEITDEDVFEVQVNKLSQHSFKKRSSFKTRDELFCKKVFSSSKLKLGHFIGMGDDPIQSQWVKLGDQLLLIYETSQKLEKVEGELQEMAGTPELAAACDEVNLECKIDEYEKVRAFLKNEKREVLEFARDTYNSIENQVLQLVLLQERIDEGMMIVKSLQ